MVGPKELRTTYLVNDGTQLNFRPIHPTDEPRMRELFYKLSEATIYYRFMGYQKRVSRQQIQDFVYIDHRNDVTIVGTMPEAHGEEIIAVGSYYLDQKTNLAEVAFTVADSWQNKGIGTFLLTLSDPDRPAQRHPRLHRRGAARQQSHAGGHQQVQLQDQEPVCRQCPELRNGFRVALSIRPRQPWITIRAAPLILGKWRERAPSRLLGFD